MSRSWKVWNEVAVDQPKTVKRVGAEADEAAIGSIATVEAAMAAEVAENSLTVASSAIVRGGCDGSSGCCHCGSGGAVILSSASVAILSSSTDFPS